MAFDNLDLPYAAGDLALAGFDQPWSSPEQYVIFSIDGEEDDAVVEAFEAHLQSWEIGFKRLKGCYKGMQENSWIINSRNWLYVRYWHELAGQESVLHLGRWSNGGRDATLYFADGHREHVGRFMLEPKEFALKQEAWTFDPSIPAYFVCE